MVVYKTTNLINGKQYIGSDSNNNPKYLGSGDFIKLAIKKYGKQNFEKEILEYCNSWEELMKCEEKWCNFYNVQTNPNFYNCTNKGKGSKKGRKTTQEFKNKLSIINIGNKYSLGKHKISILQYDLQGNFIKEWDGAIDIFNELKIKVTKCCRKKGKTAGGFIWRYKNEPLDLNKENLSEILTKRDKGISKPITNIHRKNIGLSLKGRKCTWDTSTMRNKIVLQYDLQGNFIKEWDNAQEACNKLNLNSKTNIQFCCRNNSGQAYGYKWKYKEICDKNVGK